MGRTNSTWRELLFGRSSKSRRTANSRRGLRRDGRSLRMEPLEKRELLSVTPAGYWELDETEGTTAFDTSGNGLSGTLVNGPQWTADGKLGGAIDLDGNNQYIEVADSNLLDNTAELTVSTWVYADTLDGQARGVVSKRNAMNSQHAYSLFFYTGNKLHVYIDGANDVFASNTVFQTGRWYHIAATYDGSLPEAERVKLYVDGVLDTVAAETSSAIANYASPLTLGTLNADYHASLDGKIDDTRIYNQALSAEAIQRVKLTPTVAITDVPTTAEEGTEITLGSSIAYPDPSETYTYAWNVTKNGTPYVSGTDADLTFTPDDNATYVVSLVVTDNDGGQGSITETIEVGNVAPAFWSFPQLSAYPQTPAIHQQSRDGSRLHMHDTSGQLPLVASYAEPAVGNDYTIRAKVTYVNTTTELGVLARADVDAGHGYVLSLDPTNAYFNLIRIDSADGTFTDLANHHVAALTVHADDVFEVELTVHGSRLTGRLFDASGALLAVVEATDGTYASGVVGAWAWQKSGAIEGVWSDLSLTPAAFPALAVYPQMPSVFEQSAEGTSLHVHDATGQLPLVAGYAESSVGDDCTLGGTVTFANVTTELGLMVRADLAAGQGYVLSLDPTNSYFNLIRVDSAAGEFTDLANHHLAGLTVGVGDSFFMEFTANGSILTGKLYSGTGQLLDTIEAVDASYAGGVVGTWAWQKSGPIEGQWSGLGLARPLMPTLAAHPQAPDTFVQFDGGSALHVQDSAGLLPLVAACAASTVGDNYSLGGDITFTNVTTELGFVARGDIDAGYGYVLSLDPTNSYFNLIKLTSPTTFEDVVNHHVAGLVVDVDDTFSVTFELHGSHLAGHLFDSEGVLLASVTATDDSYRTGVVGAWAWNKSGSIDGSWSKMHLAGAPAGLDGADHVDAGSPYTLTLGVPRDPGRDTVTSYTVHWGDGHSSTFTPQQLAATDRAVSHAYSAPGFTVITVDVSDEDGTHLAVGTKLLTVEPALTVEITGVPTSPEEGTPITLGSSITDPDPSETYTYAWNVTKNGTPYVSGTDADLTFTPDDDATYVVTLTVTDNDGGQGTATETVEVGNVAPTVQITGVPASSIVGTAIALDSLVDDPGTLDDTFTYAWTVTKDWVEFATGTESDFTFTPDGFAVYVVTLAVTDKDGGVGTATATIEIGGIAHWQFNETAGTTAYDASGNWLNGTLVGGAQWTTDGKLGGAIDLDGNSQYVEVADSNLLDNTSQLTVSTWVYADTLDGQARGIVSKRAGYNSQHAYSLFFHTGNRLHVYIDGAGDVFSSNTVFQTGRWYHVAVTYDGSLPEAERVKLYVDGKLDKVAAETSSAIPDYASNLTLGTLNAGYATSLDGKLDDTRIYNQALSADAIAEQARQPVAYWKLDETEGTSASDVSGNALTGTLTSGAQWTADGKVGGAIELDGNNQYVQVADSPALDATSQLTISTWVYADTLDGQARGIISKRVSYNNKNAYSLFFHTGNRLHVYIDGAGDVFSSNTVFQTGRWYHVAVTYDGSLPEAERVKLYVDGKLDKVAAETSSAIPNYASPLTLGSLNADYQASLDGRIDETRIYNQALSAKAIAEQARLPVAQWLLDETSGTSAYDTSGNGLTGTLANGAQWTMDDTLGGVVEFDGNNQYVHVADSPALDATSQLTISTWVYADTLDGQARGIVSKRNGMNSQHAYSLFFYTDNKLHVYIDGANDVFASSTVFETGQWYHVAVTYDGSLPEAERVKLYVDGVLDTVAAETSSAIPNYASPLTLGTLNANYHASLDGRMDDTRVYNQAFDAEDIAALAVAPGAPLPPQAATNLAATVLSNTRVALAWDDNAAGEYGYLIETSTDGETFSFAGWAPLDATSHTVTGLTADTQYFFRVVAYNAGGYTPSVAIEATTEANLPLTPADLEATAVGSNQVELSWTVDPDSEQDGFRVEISTEPRDHTTQWRFDETGGTTAFDSSANSLNGTLAGGAQWTNDGKSGGAIELDGNNQYVEIADNALLDGASELTISTWVYADTLDGQPRAIVSKRAGYNSQNAYSLFFHTGNKLHVYIDGSNDVFSSETVFQTGRWYHVAVTYNGNLPEDQRVKLYVDGRLDTVAAETSAAIPDYASNLTLGTLNAGYYASLDGKLDDTRIYRQALTADQIARQAQKPAAQWSLDETDGTEASDAAGNGQTGTLVGGAQWTTDGHSGGAIDLDGNGQYVQVADSAALDGASELTISTWVYADTLDGEARGIVSKRNGMNSQHAYSLFFYTDNKLHVYIDGSEDVFASDTVFETGRWYHIAVTYDGALPEAQRVKLYVDGVLDTVAAESSEAIPNYASSLTLGTLNAGYSTSLDGRIDDTRIYRQALSAQAVASLAQPVAEPTWTLGEDGTSATVTGLAANTTYYFHVVATSTVGQSAQSNEIEVQTTPAAPTELAATDVSMGSVTLAWTAGANGQYGFRVEQSTDGGATFTEIATAWDPEFVVDNLMPNTQYAFRVHAYNAAGQSEYTTAVEITTDSATTAPTAPSDLSASAVSGAAAISLTWTDNSDNEAGFVIQQSSNGSDFTDIATTDPNCTTWTVANLLSGKQYSFRVRATNHMGDSADSGTATATTASVASAPYVKQAAVAADSLVTGTSTTLSVFGVNTASGADYDTDNDSNLTYTWAATMLPPGATAPTFTVSGSENGTNAAKNATVTFASAGTYWLTVTLENTATSKSTTSSVAVTVAQTADDEGEITFTITPASASLHAGETLQFTATGVDQFGNDLDASALTWTATAGDITPEGFFTAPEGSANVTVTVTSGSSTDSSTVTVTNAAPTVATAAEAVQVPATDTAALSVLGADDAGESKLTYTWTCLVKPAGADDPTITVEGGENGANAARNATATFTSLGNYQFQVTITDGGGLSVTDSVAITVVQTLTSITLAPSSPSVALGGTQQFTATGYDQFEDPMAEPPEFYFSATAGSIDADGLYTAPSAAVPATVSVSSGGVVARADVSLTDPSPTTSARFGNTWLADWWVEALGSPDTRQPRVEQASGTMAYALSTGFIVDPTATFELATPENSSNTTESSTPATQYEWEVDGVVYASIEETTSTLVVTKTLDAYGAWTYAEVLTSTYTVTTTMAGEAFATVTGSYGYAFNASGGGDISAYTFAATVLAPVVGATEEGAAAGAWAQTVGATDSISHTRNHATGERSGRRFGSGGAGMTFPSYTVDDYLQVGNGNSDFEYNVDYTYDDVNGWTATGTTSTTWADSGSTSDLSTEEYEDSGDGWSYKETSSTTSNDEWSYSYTLCYTLQSDDSWQATSGSGRSEGSGSWTWSYNGGGNYWPAALDAEVGGTFTNHGSDQSTYEYETSATYSDGAWHETGTGQVADAGYTHYTYQGEGSYSDDDGDGSQEENGYQSTSYDSTIDYTMTDCHWDCASGTADYSEKWSDRWSYSVTDLSGNVETNGWDDAYKECYEDYTFDTERGLWVMTSAGGFGDGEYGWLQTTTDPIPYTADGEHDGNDWEIEGTYKTNEGAGVEYAYQGDGTNVFGLWFYDGQGSVTSYTTSGSSFSGTGEYGVGDEEVNGTVTAEGSNQFRSEATTDYVLDLFGAWEVDGYRRATSGETSTKWSYSMFDSVYEASGTQWSVSGNKNKGETYHTASEYYRGYQRDPGQQNWSYDLDRSYSSSSIGMSKDASYSGSGTYTHTLAGDNSGTIDGTVDANGKSSYDTTYTERSTLNASGSWNTPTRSVTMTDDKEDNWSYEGKGDYERYKTTGRPSEIYGTITESGTDKRDIEFSVTSTRNSSGIWSVTDSTGKILTSSESTYGHSGSGTYTSSDEFWESTATTDESGSGNNLEQLVVRYEATGGNWKQTESNNSITADSKESLDYVNSGSGPGLVTLMDGTDAEVTRYSTREYHEGKESSDRTPTTGGAATQTITSHGTRTFDSYYEPYTIPPALEETCYQQDEFGVGESQCVQANGTCTNMVRGVLGINGHIYDELSYGQPDGMLIDYAGYYYYGASYAFGAADTGRNAIGTAPLSGYAGTQSHSFDSYTTPSMTVDYNGTLGPLSDVMAAAPGGMALLSAPAATSPLAATGLFAAPAAATGTAASSGLLNLGFATFDAAGRVASVANGNGSNTRFTYDSGGNLATVLDAVGNMTQWVYDAEGQITEEINPLGDSRYYVYNQDGTLARYTDRNGRVRVYEYDGQQRVTAEIWYANTADADAAANPVNTIQFAYDAAGRITSEWDNLSSVSYVYSDSGLLAATTQESAGGPTVVLAYAYNDAGLRTSTAATIDGVADYVDEYAYDSTGRLVAIAQYGAAGSSAVAAKEISLGYNEQGLLATVARYTDGNLAVQAQYTYDSAGRLATLVYSQGDTILASYAWAYDTAADSVPSSSDQPSDITPQTSLHWLPSGGLMPGQDTTAIVNALWEGTGTPASLITEITSLDGTVSYSYDSAGQLLAATYTTGQAAEAFSYDAAGNRITANGAAYLTGPNNQLLFDGVFSYSYDPEGNRTARFIDVNANGLLDAGDTAATTYAWDHRNRLIRVTDYDLYGDPATRAVDYLYDTENRWIGRDVDLDADGQIDTRTRFAYDGNQIVMQFDRADATTGGPAEPLTLENLSHRYLWDPAAVDQLMADEQVTNPAVAGDIVWPLGDHQGTIRDLAAYDSSADATTIVNHRTFDAYGNLQSQTSATVDCLFAYTGRPLDQTTGLQNNLHRWYDPAVGRWISEDPIGLQGEDGNPYGYVGNNPINTTDPIGLREWWWPYEFECEDDYTEYLQHQKEARASLPGAIEDAALANGAYSLVEGDTCQGWDVVLDRVDDESGFRAVVYHRQNSNGDDEYVLAFAGTDVMSKEDWITNLAQGLGALDPQYELATGLAYEVIFRYGRDNVRFVGHSLGGGLAATAAIEFGLHATTFNPAGVHPKSIKNHPENWSRHLELITTYRVFGELLTTLQDSFTHLGYWMPDTNGRIHTVFPENFFQDPFTAHTMPAVQSALRNAYKMALSPIYLKVVPPPKPGLLERAWDGFYECFTVEGLGAAISGMNPQFSAPWKPGY